MAHLEQQFGEVPAVAAPCQGDHQLINLAYTTVSTSNPPMDVTEHAA
jgi:hypothetical protein